VQCTSNDINVAQKELSSSKFFNEFVGNKNPLLLKNVLAEMLTDKELDLSIDVLSTSALAAVSMVDKTTLRTYLNEKSSFKLSIHSNLKSR